jgi:hypothetical protein
MSAESFKSDFGSISKLIKSNCPIWRDKMRHVLIAMDAYKILTGEALHPVGSDSTI